MPDGFQGYSPRTGRHVGFRIHAAHHPDGPAGRPSPTPHEDHRGRAPAAGSRRRKERGHRRGHPHRPHQHVRRGSFRRAHPGQHQRTRTESAKLLSTRLPQPMLHMLHRAGELGDRLQVSVYAVGGLSATSCSAARRGVRRGRSGGRRRRHRLCQGGWRRNLEAASASTGPS